MDPVSFITFIPRRHGEFCFYDGTAVCQGYSLLFYRLALELGVDARFIGGYTDDGEPHAWNIVKLGDEYYNLDSTWDAGYDESEYKYYLRGSDFFDEEHLRDPEYVTDQFYNEYPVPEYDFDPSTYEPDDEHRHYFYLDVAGEAGCTMDGAEIYKCICGETEPVVIASDGHIDDNSDNYCEVCGENIGVADEFPVIITGETKELDVEKGKFTHTSFTPSVSGIYSLSFSADEGVYGFLYDDEGDWINYDSGKNITINAFMYAGKTYCLGVLLHGGKEGEASVSVLCDEENPDVTCPTTTEPTTTEPVTTEKPSEPDATVNDINPGETLSYDFDSLEDAVTLKFIPSVSGTYTFYSTSESDLVGEILAEDMETVIGANDDVDYEGGEYDFSVSCYLEAGKLYYLCAFFTEYEDEAGPFTVTLIMGDSPFVPENDI